MSPESREMGVGEREEMIWRLHSLEARVMWVRGIAPLRDCCRGTRRKQEDPLLLPQAWRRPGDSFRIIVFQKASLGEVSCSMDGRMDSGFLITQLCHL